MILWSMGGSREVVATVQSYCRISVKRQVRVLNELAYKGRAGRSFTTSLVPFLPNAGLALILNCPLWRLVKPSTVLSSSVVSTSVGLPIALSVGRLNRFHILELYQTNCPERIAKQASGSLKFMFATVVPVAHKG